MQGVLVVCLLVQIAVKATPLFATSSGLQMHSLTVVVVVEQLNSCC